MPCEHCNCEHKEQPKHESVWQASRERKNFPPLTGDAAVDVAIVGGGITGITAAYLLKKAGKRVAVIEAAEIGSGVTGYTTAHITEVLDVRFKDLLYRFGIEKTKAIVASQRAALERIASIVAAEHIDCDFRRVPGYLYSEKADTLAELKEEKDATDTLGMNATLLERAPLPFPTVGALRFDNQAEFHPLKYIQALAALVHGGSSAVYEHTRVEEIGKTPPHRIKTKNGTVTAKAVILATHTPILKLLSLQSKIGSYRSYVIGATLQQSPTPEGLFWDMEHPYHYMRSYRHGETTVVIVGGEDHRQGAITNTKKPYKRLERYICERFPVASLEYQWSAQLFTPYDGLPFIGATPGYEQVYLATGFSGNGMTGGTLSALILADMALGKEHPWAHLYRPTRFTLKGVWGKFLAQQLFVTKQLLSRFTAKKPMTGLETVKAGQGALVNLNGKTVAAYRDPGGTLTTVSPICTHVGCMVQWNATEKTWDCPCHGSRFLPNGEVKEGPAVRALPPVQV